MSCIYTLQTSYVYVYFIFIFFKYVFKTTLLLTQHQNTSHRSFKEGKNDNIKIIQQ